MNMTPSTELSTANHALLELLPTEEELEILVPDPCVLLGWRGSLAHGVYLNPEDPSSVDDRDLMGVCIAPLECYLGNKEWGSRGTKEVVHGDWDVVHYEIRKVFGLLLNGNPNVVSLLWLEPTYYLSCSPLGRKIIENRDIFSSKRSWKAFSGYAWGQYERMRRGEFKGHMGAKRRALFDQHGYDCKAAAHMIRLVRMAKEFYSTGQLQVLRTDYRELLEIKQGKWTLNLVEEEFHRVLEEADQACDKSNLPDEPKWAEAAGLLKGILCYHFQQEVHQEAALLFAG